MMTVDAALNFYKGKRVFITGDTGFKGAWLSLWLHLLGADVMGYALPPERNNDLFRLLKLNNRIKHVNGNILDHTHLKKVCHTFRPHIIFHLAAQSLVRRSYENPKLTFEVNVQGTVNVLESARSLSSLKSLICVTSDKCYKNKEWVWGYREIDEMGGKDPYSASKGAAELIFNSYKECFFNNNVGVASVRAGNVIGGGDRSPDRIIPDCIRSLEKNKSIHLRNPSSTRPWQHVLDPLSAYLLLGIRLKENPAKFSGSWNFGPEIASSRSVKEVSKKVVLNWGKGQIISKAEKRRLPEANLLFLNCDKARYLLKWKPHWDFDKSIEETVRWYKEAQKKKDIFQMTADQIHRYLGKNNDS